MSDPLWINADAGAPEYNAQELRRAQAAFLFPGVTDRFGARSGVRPHSTNPVSLAGTTWTVQHLTAVVYPGLTATAGPYVVQHPSESAALSPADGSNPRIDALDLQVQDDDEDASGFRRSRVVYVTGTPAGSPSAPALTATSLRLATILVPAGGSPAPSIQSQAAYTVASGGILPVRDNTEGPSAGLYHGMTRYRQDEDVLEVWDGSAWSALAQAFVPFKDYVQDPDGATTTSNTYTGTSITVPSGSNPAGARFKVTATGHLSSTVNDDNGELAVRRGTGTGDPYVFAARRHNLRSSGMEASGFAVDDPPAGAVTYGLFIRRVSGTGTVSLSGTAEFEARLAVEFFDLNGT